MRTFKAWREDAVARGEPIGATTTVICFSPCAGGQGGAMRREDRNKAEQITQQVSFPCILYIYHTLKYFVYHTRNPKQNMHVSYERLSLPLSAQGEKSASGKRTGRGLNALPSYWRLQYVCACLGARAQFEVESVGKVSFVGVTGVVPLYTAALAVHPLVAPALHGAQKRESATTATGMGGEVGFSTPREGPSSKKTALLHASKDFRGFPKSLKSLLKYAAVHVSSSCSVRSPQCCTEFNTIPVLKCPLLLPAGVLLTLMETK